MGFRFLTRVRYAECDAQGIAFNTRWGEWIDLGTTELLRALFGRPDALDYRLVNQSTTWHGPARFDDVIEVQPVVVQVGRTSFEVVTRCLVDGEMRVESVTTYVAFRDGRKWVISDDVRVALETGAACVIDRAQQLGEVTEVVALASVSPEPWRNGQGTTRPLWNRLGRRVSVAEISASVLFSTFPGTDRVLGVLEGEGVRLDRAGLMATVSDVWAFPGEDVYSCSLVDGTVLAVNAMVERDWGSVTMRRAAPGVLQGLLVACEGGLIGGRQVQRGDLVEGDGPLISAVPAFQIQFAAR